MKLTNCAVYSLIKRTVLKNKACNGIHKSFQLNINYQVNNYQTARFSSHALTTNSLHTTRIKLDSPQFNVLITPEMKKLINIFNKYNYELRIVGGAIRDLLMQKQPLDIDFATSATPDQMKRMFRCEDDVFSTFKDGGESHGTVSVRIKDKENFEISTLRIFVKNGNTSKLEFTTDWYLDASRRDLTINSMFLDFNGTVYDYFNGIEDLKKERIRFVGNADDRIREDYLRILRYFRFYGQIVRHPNNHELGTLQAIKRNINGLYGISGQRIWTELRKILSGNFKFELMQTMFEVGIVSYIGLPLNINIKEFERLRVRACNLSLHPQTIIASLLNNENDMSKFDGLMKLSNFERELGYFIIRHRNDELGDNLLKRYQELIVLATDNTTHVRDRIEQVLSYKGEEKLLTEFKQWEAPKFPVSGNHLINLGIASGKRMGYIRMAMKKRWFDSSFRLTERDLLNKDFFDEIVHEVNIQYPKKRKKSV